MVHIARLKSVAVLKQGDLLNIAPAALGAVGVDGFHPIAEGALGSEVLYCVELVGDIRNQTIIAITELAGTELSTRSDITGIDVHALDSNVAGTSLNTHLVKRRAVQHSGNFLEIIFIR